MMVILMEFNGILWWVSGILWWVDGVLMGFHITSRKIKFYFQICLKYATYLTVIVIGSTTVLWVFFGIASLSTSVPKLRKSGKTLGAAWCGRLLPHPLFDPSTFSGLADLHFIGRREVGRWRIFWDFCWGYMGKWMGKWMGTFGRFPLRHIRWTGDIYGKSPWTCVFAKFMGVYWGDDV